jgi:hypothetical protein
MRREWRNVSVSLKKNRRSILATTLILISLAFPTLWYTKYLIEDGYASLITLKDVREISILQETLYRSRGDFERANILFAPFRILPGDTIALADAAIESGLALTRGLS